MIFKSLKNNFVFAVFYILKELFIRDKFYGSQLIREIYNSRICIKVSQLHFPPNPHPKEKIEMDDTRLAKH